MNDLSSQIIDIATAGWEGVNSGNPLPPEQTDTEQHETDRALAQTFDTDAGKIAMQFLEDVYLNTPSWAPGYSSDYGFFREGQNTLVREIKARIDRAKDR